MTHIENAATEGKIAQPSGELVKRLEKKSRPIVVVQSKFFLEAVEPRYQGLCKLLRRSSDNVIWLAAEALLEGIVLDIASSDPAPVVILSNKGGRVGLDLAVAVKMRNPAAVTVLFSANQGARADRVGIDWIFEKAGPGEGNAMADLFEFLLWVAPTLTSDELQPSLLSKLSKTVVDPLVTPYAM